MPAGNGPSRRCWTGSTRCPAGRNEYPNYRHGRDGAYSPPVDRRLTLAEARAFLPDLLAAAGQVLAVRADAVELAADLGSGLPSRLGGLPELKGLQARLHSALDWFGEHGVALRGWAPLLVDLPGEYE